ncbi:ABC transporter substrate-binding protein [Granulosicoccus sp. 3-233]|uniref:ABC transporter substrate-binding protein n=1 Tax=Granulosicoccus sp. 3-233 TaxID=3417969 RepID=UPI003D34BC96
MKKPAITPVPALLLGVGSLFLGAVNAATLDIAIDSSPAGLDPHLITAFNSVVIVQSTVYEGLTRIDKDLSVVPGLASSWTVSDDGKRYEFTLPEGVTFHDGSDFDAEDVAASIRRVQSEQIASPLASRVTPITSMEVLDDFTIALNLDEPFAAILSSLSGIAIVPAELELDKQALQQIPVGTGPFKFDNWQPNSHISLTKFDDYRVDGLPKIDEVKVHFVPESATRQVGIGSGEYDLLPAIDPATALQLQASPAVTLQTTRDVAYTLLGMNTSRPPLDQAPVRRAINHLLNRQDIINGALFGAGVPAGPLSPALATWAVDTQEFGCYQTDVDKATALFEEASIDTPVKLSLLVLPRQDARDIAQVIQQQLAAGGFEIELLNKEIGEFVQDWRNSDFDLFVSANGGSPDPDEYFYRTFRSGGSTNVFQYADAEIDAWLDDGRRLVDPDQRKSVYDKVQTKLACEGPVAHLAYSDMTTAVGNKVSGFEILSTGRLASLLDASVED